MTAMPTRIASFWHGGALPPHCWLSLKSFVDHGHQFTLYSYDPVTVPFGVEGRDARDILPEGSVFKQGKGRHKGTVGPFSSLFRYKMLLAHGGWWVDTDVICLSSALTSKEIAFAREDDKLFCNAILKLSSNHPLAKHLYDAGLQIYARRGSNVKWRELGPRLLTKLIVEYRLKSEAVPNNDFYPIHWKHFKMFMAPDMRHRVLLKTQSSSLVHLWNEMFRLAKINPWLPPPPGSYLSFMYEKHGITGRVFAEIAALNKGGPFDPCTPGSL